jgi:hypothetical protein
MSATRKTSGKAVSSRTPNTQAKKHSKIKEKQDSASASESDIWQLITPIDASLEFRPPLRPLAPGERSLEFAVQANHATLPQGGGTQVDLRLRAEILLPEGPMGLAEIHYLGVANLPNTPENVSLLHSQLYPIARAGLQTLLQLAGQVPPLPPSWDDIKSQINNK